MSGIACVTEHVIKEIEILYADLKEKHDFKLGITFNLDDGKTQINGAIDDEIRLFITSVAAGTAGALVDKVTPWSQWISFSYVGQDGKEQVLCKGPDIKKWFDDGNTLIEKCKAETPIKLKFQNMFSTTESTPEGTPAKNSRLESTSCASMCDSRVASSSDNHHSRPCSPYKRNGFPLSPPLVARSVIEEEIKYDDLKDKYNFKLGITFNLDDGQTHILLGQTSKRIRLWITQVGETGALHDKVSPWWEWVTFTYTAKGGEEKVLSKAPDIKQWFDFHKLCDQCEDRKPIKFIFEDHGNIVKPSTPRLHEQELFFFQQDVRP